MIFPSFLYNLVIKYEYTYIKLQMCNRIHLNKFHSLAIYLVSFISFHILDSTLK